MIKQSKVAYN